MNVKRVFFDTNILLYAHDSDAGVKRRLAADALRSAWDGHIDPVVSVQVLQEFLVHLRKKTMDLDASVSVVSDYLIWRVIGNDLGLFMDGMEIMKRFGLSYWDSAIIAAARRAKAEELWTEDLNHGQDYGEGGRSLRAVNPFLQE